uniref:ribonuclease H n=1 Tax=Maylandia zebra TaxID=106582 RepID=A0A3P9CGM2_9CICH
MLIQYVDDLLLSAPTADICLEATRVVLQHLADTGFKVSKTKLQIARKQVSFLGRMVSQSGISLSPEHRNSILHHPKPLTVKDMLSFLGLTGYSRTYVPDYVGLTSPLRALVNEQGMRNLSAPLSWTTETEQAFIKLKQQLSVASDLAVPDYALPFHLDVSGTGTHINGILFQKKGGERKVLTYVSVMLDNTEKRHPPCTQHVSGLAKIIQKTAHIVMNHPLKILTSHSVVAYVSSQAFTLTSLRQRRLSTILEAPHITYSHEATNNWLLLAEQAADKTASDCIVCMGARPTLRVVPAPVNSACLLHLMNNTKRGHCSYLENHFPKTQRSVSNKPPFFSSDVAVNNFTCINLTGNAVKLGSLNSSWCTEMTVMKPNFRPTARADLWWWCGNNKLYDGFPRDASGLCALITLILPVLVTPVDLSIKVHEVGHPSSSERRSKRSLIPGSAHNPTYIDAVGIPRGVPDEYKLRDQVKAGWASILWMVEINANVDRINYIHFNVQLLANYTRDGFEAVHAQLSATSLMAFQNRVATDFLLAEKGGVCSLFGQECCTYIPNNTAPDGSLTKAITGLTALTVKMKEHSGVDTAMWDSWLNMFGKYKALVASILVSISVFVAILVTCGCCCIPCIRSLFQRLIVTALAPEDKDLARQMPLLAFPPDYVKPVNDTLDLVSGTNVAL